MKLTTNAPETKSPLVTTIGLIKLIAGASGYWLGMNSLLVGLAYFEQKGSWAPLATGAFFILVGFLLIIRGTGQVFQRSRIKEPGAADYL